MPKRTRGYFLTLKGAQKLQDAKREWESQHNAVCTEEKMRELTSPFKENGLYVGTIRGIFKGDRGKDKKYIHYLFRAFKLELEDDDLTSEPQACLPKLDPNFLGREEAIANLNILVTQRAKVICIYGKGGVGKTTLAKKYLSSQEFDLILEPPMAKETKNITPIESVVEELLRDLNGEPAQEFGITLKRLKQQLKTQKVGVLIDNLEPALDKDGKFIEAHRGYVELLSVLADPDVQSVTLITSRERLNESSLTVNPYELKGLDEETWQQYFRRRDIAIDSPALSEIHKAYGGNAKAMQILSSTIQEDYQGNLEAYWQDNQGDLLINRELEDLVKSQFDRLEKLNISAYQLLCRLGCYRYQEIPSVPIDGVSCLLWDVPEEQRKRVVYSLRDRSLLEFDNGKYWLHPVIRAESVARLRSEEEWEAANCEAALFWVKLLRQGETLVVHFKKVLAFECLYHCLKGKNLELLEAIKLSDNLSSSCNMMKYAYELADSCYHIGLGYHQRAINFYLGGKPQESQKKFQESREKFQEAILEFSQLGALKLAGKVKQALDSMNISEACCRAAEPRF